LYSALDWDAKVLLGKCAHWKSNQPCDYCNVTPTKIGEKRTALIGTQFHPKQRTTIPFNLSNFNRPVCEILSYCNPIFAYPIETMHVMFVNGVVPNILNALFELKLLSETQFFVCFMTTIQYSI